VDAYKLATSALWSAVPVTPEREAHGMASIATSVDGEGRAQRSERGSLWSSGSAYEPYVGQWSRLVAREFLAWLALSPGQRWLDVGCGTGALSECILRLAAAREVVGIDPSAAFVAYVREHVTNTGVRFEVGDAQELPYEEGAFDAVVSGLVLNFVPEPHKGVAEMARVARSGGTVAAYVWDYAGGMQLMRHFWDTAVALNPVARAQDEGLRSPLCHPEPLADLFRGAGVHDVDVRAIHVPTHFRDFDDYWSPFLAGKAPAPDYAMSLDEPRRAALRERIRAGLPVEADGSIRLVARAWAARGVR